MKALKNANLIKYLFWRFKRMMNVQQEINHKVLVDA